jgi:hypothetical protein
VSVPHGGESPTVLNAEVGPVDNRASSESGGGSPGDLGGTAKTGSPRLRADGKASTAGVSRLDSADGLLAGVLPSPTGTQTAEANPTGPATTGVGLLPGEGSGGGGGSGGGSGGGVGKGIGPGTEFFGAKERASSFAYVIDCSGSMTNRGALRIAKAELVNSLDRIPPDARFSVVFYNVEATVFPDAKERAALMPATMANKDRLKERLGNVKAGGGTDHARALRAAIALKPEVIFFLTDAESMDQETADALRSEAGPIRIQAVEFGDGPASGAASPLRDLATATGGTFRHVDLSAFPSARPAGH